MVYINVPNVVGEMDEIKNIVVFDICNTLYDSNTTFDFIKYCIVKKKINANLLSYNLITSKASPKFWFLFIYGRLTHIDYHKRAVVSLLKGVMVKDLKQWAMEFYDDFLIYKIQQRALDILNENRNQEIVIASSTIHPIAQVIAKKLGIQNYVATQLEILDGICTGRIKYEISGSKYDELIKNFHSYKLKISLVLTDNFSDIDLVSEAKEKIAICYNLKQFRFWKRYPEVKILKIERPSD